MEKYSEFKDTIYLYNEKFKHFMTFTRIKHTCVRNCLSLNYFHEIVFGWISVKLLYISYTGLNIYGCLLQSRELTFANELSR